MTSCPQLLDRHFLLACDAPEILRVERIAERLRIAREALVESPGEFAIRGSIIDIYPPDAELPWRLDLFGDEIEKIDPNLTVREALLRASRKIEGRFDNQPLVQRELRMTIGDTLLSLGLLKEAIALYERDGKPLPPPTSGRDFANRMQRFV